jgi:hypothetical protein
MAGGWLFCGLYLAVSAWWFLALCLGAFTFGVVAASNLLPGFEAGGPPAVVAAFVVCVGFPSPQAAVVATTVKTVGIGGGILVYTLFSSLLFPRTATQFAADTLALALAEMRDLVGALRACACGVAGGGLVWCLRGVVCVCGVCGGNSYSRQLEC